VSTPDRDAALARVLERARTLGFLGPGPLHTHIAHADGYVAVLRDIEGRVIDLGSGGGVPGLVIGIRRPELELVLIDARERSCAFLLEAIEALRLRNARVVQGRAEELGRGDLRAGAAAVVARGFGPPPVIAECAAPLLRVGGLLVVSEPPDRPPRWPAERLARLGLVPRALVEVAGAGNGDSGFAYQVLEQAEPCPDTYPRRVGMPAKRPLF
jgi:16S rRNA (guanine527-N7)-methyltransferase